MSITILFTKPAATVWLTSKFAARIIINRQVSVGDYSSDNCLTPVEISCDARADLLNGRVKFCEIIEGRNYTH